MTPLSYNKRIRPTTGDHVSPRFVWGRDMYPYIPVSIKEYEGCGKAKMVHTVSEKNRDVETSEDFL